jgi:hypothetical protein
MDVTALSEPEQVVLLALVGLLARADGRLSQTEMSTLDKLRLAMDAERFQRVRDAAGELDGGAAIMKAAEGVTRADARELIFGVLYEMAIPDTIAPVEVELLEKLAALWGLESPLSN